MVIFKVILALQVNIANLPAHSPLCLLRNIQIVLLGCYDMKGGTDLTNQHLISTSLSTKKYDAEPNFPDVPRWFGVPPWHAHPRHMYVGRLQINKVYLHLCQKSSSSRNSNYMSQAHSLAITKGKKNSFTRCTSFSTLSRLRLWTS